jgi:hypothetical protein
MFLKLLLFSGSKEGTGSFLSPSLQLKIKLGEDAYLPCHPRGSGTLPPADQRESRVEVERRCGKVIFAGEGLGGCV